MPDVEPLETASSLVEGRQLIELMFDFLPIRQRVDKQAAIFVYGDHQLRGTTLLQAIPVSLGNGQPTLDIQGQRVDTPKQARTPP